MLCDIFRFDVTLPHCRAGGTLQRSVTILMHLVVFDKSGLVFLLLIVVSALVLLCRFTKKAEAMRILVVCIVQNDKE